MDEFKTDKAAYSPEDFQLWEANEILVLTPKFQRRSVWKAGAKSYFIDTMLRGMTVPPIYLRNTQNTEKTKTIREVVDGQQRIRTVLDFIKPDGYRLSKTLNAPWAGKRFVDLSHENKRLIMTFSFSSESFKGISDQQVLAVFCRLNMYGVPLNKQELRNGKYFGPFKQTSYTLARNYLEFWRSHKIFTETAIARMVEVELASELLIAGNSGISNTSEAEAKEKTCNCYTRYIHPNSPLAFLPFHCYSSSHGSRYRNLSIATASIGRTWQTSPIYITESL